ncbi:MAG: outer membrane lipoprotein carrier protein LolA [Thermoanaerobaculales bacterium]
MNAGRYLGAAVAVAVIFPGVALPQDSGRTNLEALGQALRAGVVWRADYRQEYVAEGMSEGEKLAGVVWVAWPDRALFRSGEPVTRQMGLEGRRVRLLDLEVPSCDEHLLNDEEWARVPLAAVLDPAGATDHFTVLGSGERGFVLVPRQPGGVDRVEVVLGKKNLPREVVVIDPQGATNRLYFTDWRTTDAPPEGRWLPEAPPDLECVGD